MAAGRHSLSSQASSTPYAADAAWGLSVGLGPGCDPLLFCTYNVTHRDELAVFLSRLS